MSAGFSTDVLIKLTMVNGVSSVVNLIGRDLLKLNHNILSTQGALNALQTSGKARAMLGAGFLAIGAGLIAIVVKAGLAGEALNHQQALALSMGLTHKQVAEGTAKAWQMANGIMGTTVSANLASIVHLRAAFGDLGEAMKTAPAYARNAVALQSITGQDGEQQAFKLAQAIHLSGASTDPTTKKLRGDLFEKQMNLYTAQIAAGGGKLKADDLLQFQKRGGSYAANIANAKDANGLSQGWINMTGFIQSQGGSSAGTALTTLNRAMKDGVIAKATYESLAGIGLYDRSKVTLSHGGRGWGSGASAGGGVRFAPGALYDEKKFKDDPFAWVWSDLIPKLKKAGYATTEEQINFIQHAKLTSNATRVLSEAIRNAAVDQQEANNVRTAAKQSQYKQVMDHDLRANIGAVKDAWGNFETALGVAIIPSFIKILQSVTTGLQAATAWVTTHQELAHNIMKVIGAVGVALSIAGAALIITATPFIWVPALIVAGIAAVVAAFVWASQVDWGKVWTNIKVGIAHLADLVGTAFQNLFADVINAIRKIPGLAGIIPEVHKSILKTDAQLRTPVKAPASKPTAPVVVHGLNGDTRTSGPFFMAPPTVLYTTNNNYVDGKLVSKSVTKQLATAVNSPPTGNPGHNTSMGRAQTGSTGINR